MARVVLVKLALPRAALPILLRISRVFKESHATTQCDVELEDIAVDVEPVPHAKLLKFTDGPVRDPPKGGLTAKGPGPTGFQLSWRLKVPRRAEGFAGRAANTGPISPHILRGSPAAHSCSRQIPQNGVNGRIVGGNPDVVAGNH